MINIFNNLKKPTEVKIPSAPDSVTARNVNELYEKLDVGILQVKKGKVIDSDVAMARLREKSCVSLPDAGEKLDWVSAYNEVRAER